MSQQTLLEKVIRTLNRLGIEYMVTGSIVSSLQGESRSTHKKILDTHSSVSLRQKVGVHK